MPTRPPGRRPSVPIWLFGLARITVPLGGCATIRPGAADPGICPPMLAPHEAADGAAAASELKALPDSSVLARMIGDDGRTRDLLRACRGT